MARIFANSRGEAKAKAWMHDVMAISGVLPQSQRKANIIYFTRYQTPPTAEASKICDELINRRFNDIDSAINRISYYEFYPSMTDSCRETRYSPEDIAKAIVFMAERLNLYWDDTDVTPYEVEAFKKTLLGAAVYQYERYITAIKDDIPKVKSSSTGPKAASSAPKNDFKQQGPKSGQARGLIGQPGEKVYIQGQYALAIAGEMPNVKSKYYAQIKPLDKNGASGSTNKVFVSASHSYGMGICYFDEMSDAQAFYDKLVKSGNVPSNLTKFEIGQVKKDKNGYSYLTQNSVSVR